MDFDGIIAAIFDVYGRISPKSVQLHIFSRKNTITDGYRRFSPIIFEAFSLLI